MESYPYSSYPDSGDSSPRSREIECENAAVSWDEPPPISAVRVKLMCSYGGRIQPRPHDNQLSYVGGETKILAVERSIRFPGLIARLASLSSAADDLVLKYQLPGEDLDALISVTNDEDLEHMMIEYDRLHRSNGKPAPRLRLFLFNVNPPIGASAAVSEQKPDRMWFVDALNSVPPLDPAPAPPQAAQPPTAAAAASPDFLFGFDKGFVPPPAVKVKDPAPESAALEQFSADPPARSDLVKQDLQIGVEPVVSPVELQKLQIAENQNQNQQQQQQVSIQQQQQQQVSMQRNGSEETLARVYPADYYLPRVQEKAAPPSAPPPAATYWPDQRTVPAGRYASVAGGDQQFYLIPAAPGVFPPAGQGYYTAVQRVHPADVYRDAAAMYTVGPPTSAVAQQQQQQQPAAKMVDVTSGFAAQVAYDSAGRAMYYTGAPPPTYQTVTSVALNPEASKVLKPSQVS